MDDLLKEFLQEATERIDATSVELLRFEKDQADPALVASLLRRIHPAAGAEAPSSLPQDSHLTTLPEHVGRKRAPAAIAQSRHFATKVRGETIGVRVDCVETIHLVNLTYAPPAPCEVAGLANLGGRLLSALYLDRYLWPDEATARAHGLAADIEHGDEEYAQLVEETEDVVACKEHGRDPYASELMAGCYRYNDGFPSILEIDAMLRRVGKSSEASLRDGRSSNFNKGASS
ncbi:chemotaxis protein CheW [Methylocystis sp. JAN1]|uniref:chemotaxis protein CheW n=1 Tax=Methylocystis sp. JAN1 TaxID=3397211 RepID=UPI003FA33C83